MVNQKKKLSGTQIQLLLIKEEEIVKARQVFQSVLNMIASEHGITNLNEWILSEDRQYLIKKEGKNGDKKKT